MCLLLGPRLDNRVCLCCLHLHLCCGGFLFVLPATKELHIRCKLCDVSFVSLLFVNTVAISALLIVNTVAISATSAK